MCTLDPPDRGCVLDTGWKKSNFLFYSITFRFLFTLPGSLECFQGSRCTCNILGPGQKMVPIPLGRISLFALHEVSQSGPSPTPPASSQASSSHPTPRHFPIVLRHGTLWGSFLPSPLLTQSEKRFRKSAVGDYSPIFPISFPQNRISPSQTYCDLTAGGRR